jgi:hypothetical protein
MFRGFQIPPQHAGRGNVFSAFAPESALAAYTATALGGPLLYNGSGTNRGVTAFLLAIGFGMTTASTAAGAVGIATGLTTAPTSTGAVAVSGATRVSSASPSPACSVYASGTVSVAPTNFLPVGQIGTAALTAELADDNFINLGGVIELLPGSFACLASSAALSGSAIQACIVWMEVPN